MSRGTQYESHGIHYEKLPRTGWRFRTRGWKYRLTKTYSCPTKVMPEAGVSSDENAWVYLSRKGAITIKEGYCWDGPSGPFTAHTDTNMRASLVHDALYQLLREKKLPQSMRRAADYALYRICLEDGMVAYRARYFYWGVQKFGAKHAKG